MDSVEIYSGAFFMHIRLVIIKAVSVLNQVKIPFWRMTLRSWRIAKPEIIITITVGPAKSLDTPSCFPAFLLQGRKLLWLPICFPAHQTPSEKGFNLKGAKFFSFRVDSFSIGRQNNFQRVASPESISFLKLGHVMKRWTLTLNTSKDTGQQTALGLYWWHISIIFFLIYFIFMALW